MRIGVDATCWVNARGYGRYARELLGTLARRFAEERLVFFLDERAAAVFSLEGDNVERVVVPQSVSPTQAAVSGSARSPFDMLRFTQAVRRHPVDVFFFPSVYTYFPLPPGRPAVVAIHDAIAERFPELTLPSWKDRLFWNLKVKMALRQARLVLTVSEYARGEVRRIHRLPDDRIRVAVEAPAEVFTPCEDPAEVRAAARRAGVPEGCGWFCYVGGFNPHKNVRAVVEAHASVVRDGGDAPPHLLLVGSPGSEGFHGEVDAIRGAVAAHGTEAFVHWTGFVPDEELRALHSGSLGLLLLSESEGFGLPAVEAAACGCPVIATTESPLPELLEGGGAFLDPGDARGAAAVMLRLAREPELRRAWGAAARSRAEALSWERAAAAAVEALRDAAAPGRTPAGAGR